MNKLLNNFITSGIDFDINQEDLKVRYQTLNMGLILTTLALLYGIAGNIIRDVHGLITIEASVIFVNIILIILLRKFPKAFEYIVIFMIAQFTLVFLFLIYVSEPTSMKHNWIFSYPILLLYLQDTKRSFYWMTFLIFMLVIAPIQTVVEVKYTLYQTTYIAALLIIINVIMIFYQGKMKEALSIILKQQEELHDFNHELEFKVLEKTSELKELNEQLGLKVTKKIEELRTKDKILEVQSKQAVMGEMISMIAHQWRQPLSTITLQIANLQFKKLLGQDLTGEETDDALSEISDTIIYLSDTIDDFQTYFNPDKEMLEANVYELLQKAINFTIPRCKKNNIVIKLCDDKNIKLLTFANEFVQVILNILNNAIDALDELSKENPMIFVDLLEKDEFIYINIQDNANGINDDVIAKIFEPYFSTKGKNGTGLGLYMSQMIVQKQFFGQISVESSNKGSTFSVRVPKKII